MRILITGGLGYIGGRLACFLKETRPKAEIILTTTRTKIYPAWTHNFSIIPLDLSNDKSVLTCLQKFEPDTIIHLAGIPQHICESHPDMARDINVRGCGRLLNGVVAAGIQRFIYFSTAQIYGALEGQITENSPVNPQNQYARTKAAAEGLITEYTREHKFKSLIFRVSNAYGYPQDIDVANNVWELVFNAFVRDALQNQQICPKTKAYRDFITMTDVVRVVDHFLFSIPDSWSYEIYNLGRGQSMTIVEAAYNVATIYQKLYGKTVEVKEPDEPDKASFQYGIDKLKSTGFNFTGDLKHEIAQTFRTVEQYLPRT